MLTAETAPGGAAEEAVALLCRTFDVPEREVRVIRAPYRICPLGAHVDHQYGPVAAKAIEHAIHLAYVPVESSEVRLVSDEFAGMAILDAGEPQKMRPGAWDNYARGAIAALAARGIQTGGMFGASVGGRSRSGLSSSAAVGIAYLLALADCAGETLSARDLVELDKVIETEFLGLKNGILDPAAIVFAERGKVAEIDTRACTARLHESPVPLSFIAFHSGLAEPLTPANFNSRVEESLQAAQRLSDLAGLGLTAPRLGDVPIEVYDVHAAELTPLEQRRARHYFEEAARVQAGVAAWQAGDALRLGELMRDSARSSMDNYEVGATPVRDLVELLNATSGVHGARFSGAGFRGCCIALVEQDAIADIVAAVHPAYGARHPQLAELCWVLDCGSADGAAREL